MHGASVERTNLRQLDPVRDYFGESRARTLRYNRADALRNHINDILTGTALSNATYCLQFQGCDGDSDHSPLQCNLSIGNRFQYQ